MEHKRQEIRNVDLARRCLEKIRDIAERGAVSSNPEVVGYCIQELSQVLLERTGSEEIRFEPAPATELEGLATLYEELGWVDSFSVDIARHSIN